MKKWDSHPLCYSHVLVIRIFSSKVIHGPVLLYQNSVVPRIDDARASKDSGLVEGEEEERNLSTMVS